MKLNFLTITALLLFSAILIYSCNDSGTKQPVNAEMGKTETGYMELGKNIAAQTQSVLAKT